MVIYNHSRYLNIAFWGVVLGELISLAHDFHFTKGLLWKFSAAIPENLGTLISEPTLKSKACLKCLYFTLISATL